MLWIAAQRHITAGLRPKGPLVEYRYEAYEAFQAMVYSIKEDVVRLFCGSKWLKNLNSIKP